MPLFEFVCSQCREEFEELIFGDERPQCPKCQAAKVDKRLSVPAPARVGASLPICQPSAMPTEGCGLPQCGGGQCAME